MNTNRIACRGLIAFCTFLFSAWFCKAQEKHIKCSLLKHVVTGKLSINTDVGSFIDPPNLYFYGEEEWNSENRMLKVYSVNASTGVFDSIMLEIPEPIVIFQYPQVSLHGDYLILTDDNEFDNYRYKIVNGKFTFLNKIKLPQGSTANRNTYLDKDKFLLSSIYNYHPEEKLFNTNVGVYDAQTDKIISFIHPNLPCIGFSHYPNEWITTSKDRIAIADPCGYKITFYDFNLKAIDSIIYKPAGSWNDIPGNKIPFETNPAKINVKELIDKIRPFSDTVSRIEKIFFLNNKQLLVCSTCKNYGAKKRRLDIFEINNPTKPIYTDLAAKIGYEANDTVYSNNNPLPLYNPIEGIIKENKIYTINSDDYHLRYNSLLAEFNRQKDIYYEKYDPKYSINVYQISIP